MQVRYTYRILPIVFLLCSAVNIPLLAQTEVNYDEANVPDFQLPDPKYNPERKITIDEVEEWEDIQRPYLLDLFSQQMYGEFPDEDLDVNFILESNQTVFDDMGVRKEVTINVKSEKGEKDISLLIYLPNQKEPVPIFLGLNFYGNQNMCSIHLYDHQNILENTARHDQK